MEKPVSIKEIAELCGVSVATVSRVINQNGRFSKETEERVLKAIEETGYHININAKSLRMNKTFTIGILIPDITNYFFAAIVNYIESLFFEKGFSTIISSTNRDSSKEQSYLKMMISQGVDGIIVISGDQDFVFEQTNSSIPYLCIDRKPDNLEHTSVISSDHYQGGYLAAEHLHNVGCKKPIFLINNPKSSSTKERIQGFKSFFDIDNSQTDIKSIIHFRDFEGYLLEQNELLFDGICCVNDLAALQTINILNIHGYRVPEDVKVIGFDNAPYGKMSNPSLTTIEQDLTSIGQSAVDTLLEIINNEDYQNKIIKFPVKLIVRDSSSK